MEIADSARKHGVADEDIRHAERHAIRTVPNSKENKEFKIGADRRGALLEIVVLDPDDDLVIIHAMPLRVKYYRLLERW